MPQPTYQLHETGKRQLRPDVAQRYADILGCSAAWLVMGEGEPPELPASVPPIRISELDVRAQAGAGGSEMRADGFAEVASVWTVPQDFMRAQTTASPQSVRIIRIYGDSMEPMFRPGDRVLVDMSDTSPSPPGIFVLWDGLGIVVKRVEFVPYSDPPSLKLISINEAYGTYTRPLEGTRINGRVIAKWHWT